MYLNAKASKSLFIMGDEEVLPFECQRLELSAARVRDNSKASIP